MKIVLNELEGVAANVVNNFDALRCICLWVSSDLLKFGVCTLYDLPLEIIERRRQCIIVICPEC